MPFASTPRRIFLSLVGAALASLVIGGCASAPKPPAPTVVATTISATDELNPDSSGRPSPLVVRVYELKAMASFNDADFFSLWDRDQETLGADLGEREEMVLRPGESSTQVRTVKPGTRFIGVVAAFRDLERSVWRGSVPVVDNQTLPLSIKFDDRSVTLTVMPK